MLTIEFRDMFMLAMHGKGAVVLLPSSGHTAHMKVPNHPLFTFRRHQMNLIDASGNVLWGDRPTPPGRKYLVHMNDAHGCKTFLKSGLIGDAVPPSLNGRIVLAGSGSRLEAPEARRYPGARKVEWEFRNTVKPHKQLLTDTLIFRLPLSGELKLRCWNSSETKDFTIEPDKDAHVVITNIDEGTGSGGPPQKKRDYPLREFDVLYDLVRSECGRPPVPVGDYPGESESDFSRLGRPPVVSEEEPICGGGEGDPPDPPEDPPLP